MRDLGSSNGIFVDGNRVPDAAIEDALTIRLGIEGPFVSFAVEKPKAEAASAPAASTAVFAARYFQDAAPGETVGEHTQMVRRAFKQVQTKQRRKYHGIVAVLVLAMAGIAGYAYYQHRHLAQQTAMAKEIFYSMKALQVDLAGVEKLVRDTQNQQGADQITKYRTRQKEMEQQLREVPDDAACV